MISHISTMISHKKFIKSSLITIYKPIEIVIIQIEKGAQKLTSKTHTISIMCFLIEKSKNTLTLRMRALVFTEQKKYACFSIFWNVNVRFHELMNQYHACLHSFEYIFHKDFKYSNRIPECWHSLPNLLHSCLVVCSCPPHCKHFNVYCTLEALYKFV